MVNNRPAMDGDRPFLAKLLFGLVHLSDKVDEPFGRFGHALFRPIGELELPDRPRTVVNRVRHLELSEYVLRHVVFGDGFHDKRIVPDRPFRRPVLVTFFLYRKRVRCISHCFVHRRINGRKVHKTQYTAVYFSHTNGDIIWKTLKKKKKTNNTVDIIHILQGFFV